MSSKAHSNIFNWEDCCHLTHLNIIRPSGVEKAKGLISEKLAHTRFCRLFWTRHVFPQSRDGLSGLEAFVNFASAATWKWPLAVRQRDKAVFFGSLEKNISLATTCITFNQPGAAQRVPGKY